MISANVIAENPTHEEFLAIRRTKITGSDVAAILGLSPYSSAYNVALEKKGKLPPKEDSTPMRLGRRAEPQILDEFCLCTGFKVSPNKKIFASAEHEWASATPDAIFDDESAGAELKLVGFRTAHLWGESGTADVPVTHFLQCLWYMGVMGLPKWYLVGQLGTSIQTHPIDRDDTILASVVTACKEFYDRYVIGDETPEPGAGDLEIVGKLFPRSEEGELLESPEIRVLVEAHAKARIDLAAAKADKEGTQAKLEAILGSKSRIKGSDFSISWTNNKHSIRTDFEKALEKAYARLPQKYADELGKIVSEFTRPIPGPRVFRVSGALFKGGE